MEIWERVGGLQAGGRALPSREQGGESQGGLSGTQRGKEGESQPLRHPVPTPLNPPSSAPLLRGGCTGVLREPLSASCASMGPSSSVGAHGSPCCPRGGAQPPLGPHAPASAPATYDQLDLHLRGTATKPQDDRGANRPAGWSPGWQRQAGRAPAGRHARLHPTPRRNLT